MSAPREPSRGTICKCGLAKSYHGGRFATDHEYEPRYPARRAAAPREDHQPGEPMIPRSMHVQAVEAARLFGRQEAEREALKVIGRLVVSAGGVIEVPDRVVVAAAARVLVTSDPIAGTMTYRASPDSEAPHE